MDMPDLKNGGRQMNDEKLCTPNSYLITVRGTGGFETIRIISAPAQ